jgi:superfamily I DNA/RNA helicase
VAEFKFRLPLGSELTRQQQRAIDSKQPIFLTGVPGSGKTVVSIYRLKNYNNSILFTYGKLLRLAIENIIDDNSKVVENIHHWNWNIDEHEKIYLENRVAEHNLDRAIDFFKQKCHYEYIIVDEGQDLALNVYKLLKEITPNLSVSADNAQKVYEYGTIEEDIVSIVTNLKKIELNQNFRNSFEIYNFAKEFVPNNPRANNSSMLEKFTKGDALKPYVYLVKTLDRTFEIIEKLIDNNEGLNIGILSEDIVTVNTYYKRLSKNYDISSYTSEDKDDPKDLKNILVTTFKSSKGMEFDIVVMPQFQYLDERNLNEYYIGATRAQTELYILAIGKLPPIFEQMDTSTYILKNEL